MRRTQRPELALLQDAQQLDLESRAGVADLVEKQRAAVARALMNRPAMLMADEPTGALDSKASDQLLKLFAEINREKQTILMVTHSARAACRASRVLFIRDGEVYHQLYRGQMNDDELYHRISETWTVLATGGEEK